MLEACVEPRASPIVESVRAHRDRLGAPADAVRLRRGLVTADGGEELGELVVGVGSRGLEEEIEGDLASLAHPEVLECSPCDRVLGELAHDELFRMPRRPFSDFDARIAAGREEPPGPPQRVPERLAYPASRNGKLCLIRTTPGHYQGRWLLSA